MTPNIPRFIQKHVANARTNGYRHAIREAGSEAGIWTFSKTHDKIFDSGRLIWEDEWDICIVLDATRYDQWQHVAHDHEWLHTQSAWSVGAASPEWYGNTFTAESLPDGERIGIVTANPFASKPSKRLPTLLQNATPVHEHLAYTDYVHQESWGCEVDGEYLDVTHPGEVTNRAHRAWQNEDLDRLVVHYMQPHLPFRSRPEWFGSRGDLDDFGELTDTTTGPYEGNSKEIWKRLRDGEESRDEVWAAYCDNLEWGLEHVHRLYRALDVEFLITSDHGNGMGEWGVWSHPPGLYTPQLRRVPWVTITGTGDREYTPVEVEGDDTGGSDINSQLAALGYREEATG